MSVLSFPRIYFRGFTEWDPGLTNNTMAEYDPINVEVVLPPGVTLETYRRWIIENDLGNWNIYGTHRCDFVQYGEYRTVVTGAELDANSLIVDDDAIGLPLTFDGKLVDLDPRSGFTSQIFFDHFTLGNPVEGLAIEAKRSMRMHSRLHWFARNRGRLPIAGIAGVIWQACFRKHNLKFNPHDSPVLAAFAQALERDDVAGLMLRFASYRTQYFQNGMCNGIRQQPRNVTELHALYARGETFSNPAVSVGVGVVGLWLCGELESMPCGRILMPPSRLNPGSASAPCEVEQGRRVLSLDLSNAIPELDRVMTKQDLGTLTVNAGKTMIASIPYSGYAREAYDTRAGIIDIPIEDVDATEPFQ